MLNERLLALTTWTRAEIRLRTACCLYAAKLGVDYEENVKKWTNV